MDVCNDQAYSPLVEYFTFNALLTCFDLQAPDLALFETVMRESILARADVQQLYHGEVCHSPTTPTSILPG